MAEIKVVILVALLSFSISQADVEFYLKVISLSSASLFSIYKTINEYKNNGKRNKSN